MSTPSPDPERSAPPVQLRWPGGPRRVEDRRAPPPPGDDLPPDDPPGAALRALPVLEADPGDPTPLRRAVVDAYDRLAEQVLGRMRALHQDVDADLAEVRSELASLRRSVEDVGDRVQLRQLRTSLDELRGDVAGLRRAVLEWPELEHVSTDIATIRDRLSGLAGLPAGDPSAGDAAARGAVAEELAGLRQEVAALRRRIALRGRGDADEGVAELSDDDVDRIAAAVAARLAPPPARRKNR